MLLGAIIGIVVAVILLVTQNSQKKKVERDEQSKSDILDDKL